MLSLAQISFLELVGIFILASWGIYIVYRAGQIYSGSVFSMLIGAYFSAYVVRDLGWPFPLALIVAVGIGAFATFLPGFRLARLPTLATAIASIALILIAQAVVRNLDFLGAECGFFHIPRVEYLLPLIYVTVVVVGFFIYRLDHSRLGRAMEMIAVNPDAATSLALDVDKVRMFLQVISGALGAAAGVFYGFAMRNIFPRDFNLNMLLRLFCFVFVGGATTMWGVVFFTPILWAMSIFLPRDIAVWKDPMYGSLLIVILILRPNGAIDRKLIRAISIKGRAWLGRLTTRQATMN